MTKNLNTNLNSKLFNGRKGQGPGQVLVYAMSIILISLIMVFGYKAIGMFVGQSGQIAKIQFASDFKSALQNMNYGDIEIKTFSIPADYKMICLTSNYDSAKPVPAIEAITIGNKIELGEVNPLVKSQWLETDNNVFLVSGIDSFYAFKVRKLHLDTDGNGADDNQASDSDISYRCIPTNGKFTLRMESQGKYIFISSNVSKSLN